MASSQGMYPTIIVILCAMDRSSCDADSLQDMETLFYSPPPDMVDITGNGGDLGLAAWCVGSSVARSETRLQIINAEEESSNSSLQSIEQHSSRREGVSREVQREELSWDDKRSWRQQRARGLGRAFAMQPCLGNTGVRSAAN